MTDTLPPLLTFRGNRILHVTPDPSVVATQKSYHADLFSASSFKSVIDFPSLWSVVFLEYPTCQWFLCPYQNERWWWLWTWTVHHTCCPTHFPQCPGHGWLLIFQINFPFSLTSLFRIMSLMVLKNLQRASSFEFLLNFRFWVSQRNQAHL